MDNLAPPSQAVRRRLRINPHPLLKDLALTAGAEFGVLLAGLLVISMFGRLLGTVALGEYLLLRRVLTWLQSGAQLGLGVALPRYVAHSIADSEQRRRSYFFATFVVMLAFTTLVSTVLTADRFFFARLLFGKPGEAPLIPALGLLMIGLGAHVSVYGYFRGILAMGRANALQFWNLALVPLITVAALRRGHSVALIVGTMGIITLLTALVTAVPNVVKFLHSARTGLLLDTRQLLRYGITRVPGDFGHSALFAVAAIAASHYARLEALASLLLGLSILTAVSASAVPLGVVLLSKVTMMLAQSRTDEVRSGLVQFLAFALELPVFAAVQLIVFADVFVRAWVGPGFTPALWVIRIIMAAIPFYLFVRGLGSVIDATSVTAYNTRNALLVLAFFLAEVALAVEAAPRGSLLSYIAAAILCALLLFAWLTARTVRHLYGVKVEWSRSAMPLAVAGVLGIAACLLHWANGFRTSVFEVCMIEILLLGVFVAVLRRLRAPWVGSLWRLATDSSRSWLVQSLSSSPLG